MEYNKEQLEALSNLHGAWAYLNGINIGLDYLISKLGLVHTYTIEFRKTQMKEAYERLSKAQEEFGLCGGTDIAIKKVL